MNAVCLYFNIEIHLMDKEATVYPAKFDPANSPIYIRNEIEVNSSPEKVWFWITNAKSWHAWYRNASRVIILNQYGDFLMARTKFLWKTFGSRIVCDVTEFVPNHQIAWTSKGRGVQAYQIWTVLPTSNGCKVVTEETQKGWRCKLGKMLRPNRVHNYHEIWLQGLKSKAEKS